MATRMYAINVGQVNTDVIEYVGPPVMSSATFAIVVDLAVPASKHDLLQALENITNYIMRDNSWPPA